MDNQRSFAIANNEAMQLDDGDIAFLADNPFELAEDAQGRPEYDLAEALKSQRSLTASQTLSKAALATAKPESASDELDNHRNAKMVTLFSIEAEMAEADKHFLDISDVEEEKQTRQKVKKTNKQRLA